MIIPEPPVIVDIIILSYAKNDQLRKLTIQCLDSLFNSEDSTKIVFNVLVLESEKNTPPYSFQNTKTIYPNIKFGYHRYMNIGLKETNNPYVCICNNDLLFHEHWASEILMQFYQFPDLGSASPICPIQHPERGFQPYTGTYYGYETRKEVSGWCLFFRREILKIIGKLDEKFTFWFADDDYACTLKKHGIQHALVTSSLVDHLESQTLTEEEECRKQRLTQRERFYFEYKWGKRSRLSYLFRLYKFYKSEFITRFH